MKLTLSLLLFFCTQVAVACKCGVISDFKSKEDLKGYSFIALVTIKKLPPIDASNPVIQLRKRADIDIEPIEIFKGANITTVYDASYNSDCALSVQEGEQWIVFGYEEKGQIKVSRCGHSVRYTDQIGVRDWKYFNGIRQLDVLKTIYQHTKLLNIPETLFLKNGQKELVQHFKDGKLNGLRTIYYPDGSVYIKEKFKNGIRVGKRNVYHKEGQLMECVEYRRGLIFKETRYQDTTEIAWYLNFKARHPDDVIFGDKKHDARYYSSLLDSLRKLKEWNKQIAYQKRFYNSGLSYNYKMYNYKGEVEVIDYLDWNRKLSEHTLYYDSGKPKFYIKLDQKNDKEIEYDYTEDGKRRDFVKQCSSCKYYFDKEHPAGKPKEVYLQ